MKKITIGFITNSRLLQDDEAKMFKRVADKMDIDLIFFNSADKMDIKEIEDKVKQCDLVYNDDGEHITNELAKTIEALGGKVVEPSKTMYYTEDKWLQYVRCVKNDIPAPKTILLPTDLVSARQEIVNFNQFPVVLKRIEGCRGDFVDKADTPDEAVEVMKKFWGKGEDRFPIIAQEFVTSNSYRVLTIGGKIIQTALKKSPGWKATGCEAVSFTPFEVDKELEDIIKKLLAVTELELCGYDFARHLDKWVFIEANANPSFDFYREGDEMDQLAEKVLEHLKKLAKAARKSE